MVHHIRVQGDSFVSARGGTGSNKEQIFGLIAGFEVFDLTEIITRSIPRLQDLSSDHLKGSAGLSPKLLLTIIISQYGFQISKDIVRACRSLDKYDTRLQSALQHLWTLPPTSFKEIQKDNKDIRELNDTLIQMNTDLTGARSIMHYLAASAELLIDRVSDFQAYVTSRLEEWVDNPARKNLIELLSTLDCCQERLRDRDKLQIVQKSMKQYMVDIDALHQHIDINIGMVSQVLERHENMVC